ncbi:MAG: DHHA1 domain-containing protein [Candidatus Aenigmatarchaeota archaeon]
MKTIILTHSDSDGICAGAVALSRFPDAQVFFTKPVSFVEDLKACDAGRIIITDIAITHKDIPEIIRILEDKSRDGEILYFDHHPLPDSARKRMSEILKTYIFGDASASELIYKYYQDDIPPERVWVAIYGAIGDYEEKTEFVRDRLNNWDARALHFEASMIFLGMKDKDFDDYDSKRRMVQTLASGKNPSDIPGLMEAARRAVTDEFRLYELVKENAEKSGDVGYVKDVYSFGFRGPSALFAATVTDSRVGLAAFLRKDKLDITMRSRDYSVKLSELAENAGEAVGGSGGGHSHAAGARIPLDKFEDFVREVNRLLKTT